MSKNSFGNRLGIGCLGILIIVAIVLIGLPYAFDKAYVFYELNCTEKTLEDCLFHRPEEEKPQEGSVTATGSYSLSGHSVIVTMHIPLTGGPVTGQVSGDCYGNIKGSFTGQNNGAISGSIHGACSIFVIDVPGKVTFKGSVNKDTKSVPIGFTGSGGGFSKTDSMMLSY
jgi:hypothetical protein